MGNKLLVGSCFGNDQNIVEFEDMSDASFDYISVSMHLKETCNSPTNPSVVSIVPLKVSTLTNLSRLASSDHSNEASKQLTFNDQLNRLSWDPVIVHSYVQRIEKETVKKSSFVKQRENEIKSMEPKKSKKAHQKPRRWCDKIFGRNKKQNKTNKSSETLDISLKNVVDVSKQSYDLVESIIESSHEMLDLPSTASGEVIDTILCGKGAEDPLSDTESEDSSYWSDKLKNSWWCLQDAENDFKPNEQKPCRSVTICSTIDSEECLKLCAKSILDVQVRLQDYICHCGECPRYQTMEKAVTESSSWMSEEERVAICSILQAYFIYNEKVIFHTDMIAVAEECLVVFHSDERTAFHAFAAYGRSIQWE
ncbi:hypothetical protein ABG067_003343 [Albugo candida]|uniref:Uncharacterized protein n=1 Tax=Albugo candida TaxID=65357 RepID=A0A024G1Y9_9STRA|nr:unnamed protein product [Albugo candida]|eukprot:CCI40785.1 unnamed protein product [Albugo candida]